MRDTLIDEYFKLSTARQSCEFETYQKVKSKVQVFDTPQVVNCLKVESDAALLPS